MVGDSFHELVVEFDGLLGGKSHATFKEGILQAHDAEPDRAVAQVGALGGFSRIEVDVDHVVQGADGHLNGLAEHVVVEGSISAQVRVEYDGPQVADGGFILAGIEGDLGAEIRRVDDAYVILWAAKVAGILECDPGMTCLEQHLEHLFPDFDGWNLL